MSNLKYEWVIWYSDESSFSNLDGNPEEAPRLNVICISTYSSDHGRMIWHGTDYYIWETEFEKYEWISVDREGLSDYLDRPGRVKIRLRGRHVPPKVFWKIYNQANLDPRLPPRSSLDPRELQPREI